jgi:signal transduction histidine kinase
MLTRWTIRQRILITFMAVVLVGSLVQLFIAGGQLQQATLDFYRSQLETDALIAGVSLRSMVESFSEGEREEEGRGFEGTLDALQSEVGHDFLLLDSDYRVLAATRALGLEPGQRLRQSPELAQASPTSVGFDIRADDAGVKRMFVASPIAGEEHSSGYIVLSQPTAAMDAEVQQRWLELIAATLPVAGLVVAASLWISASISRPIQRLHNSALHMAEGALNTRIEVESQDEIGQLGSAFNYMAEQLENLLKTQRSFVSNAAHELRTPLMTLKLRIEALNHPEVPDQQRAEYLIELRQEVDYMAQLVTSLLTLARIDEGRHTGADQPYDSTSLVHDIARNWRIEAQKTHLTFCAEIAPDLPDLAIPANDLRVVLDNVLSNALKYTPQGTITLRAWGDNETVNFSVSDSGRGFAAQESEQLFVRFYRAAEARAQHIPGTGLGLAIVRAILEQHQGRIEAHSRGIGQGATFIVTLPARLTTAAPA